MPGHRRRGVTAGRRLAPYIAPTPYHGWFAPPYNSANRLSIPSPVAGANPMHPDVIDFGASGWHGYRYWMSHTPYNGTGDTEVPCIVATNDITSGGTWVVPTGYTNPITADYPGAAAHMADSDICYDAATDRLYVFYIGEDGSTFQNIRSKWTSGNGSWSTEVDVVTGPDGVLANPSLVKTATGWRIYYTSGLYGLRYRDTTSTPDAGYGAEVACTLQPITDGSGLSNRLFQNLNMVRDVDGTLVAVVADADGSTTLDGKLYFARSLDGGVTFVVTGPPVLENGVSTAWDAGGIYRCSLLVNTTSNVVPNGTSLHLFYSAFRDGITIWGIGYTQIPAQVIRF